MKAYKCDRCGKLFENKKPMQLNFNTYYVTNNPFMSGCLDLCDECFNELQEWMAVYKETESEEKK